MVFIKILSKIINAGAHLLYDPDVLDPDFEGNAGLLAV
jgi:hypothetical protein